jgi:dipeptide/tripeptide permease
MCTEVVFTTQGRYERAFMTTPAATPTLEQIQTFEGRYPKQLWSLFFSEMWERFSFYGMRGVLTFFMVNQLMMAEKTANLQYGATQAFVYAFTFIGGLFADKILGFRKSLFWGGSLMVVGSLILAVDPKQVRREGAVLGKRRFDEVIAGLEQLHGPLGPRRV